MSGKRKVTAVPVESLTESKDVPGAFKFYRIAEEIRGLNFICPCGCGAVLGVSFDPGRWTWDGNRDRPTVKPSIRHMDGCRWHGFLTAGEFLEC